MPVFNYEITLPKAEEIMVAQSGEKVEGFQLTDVSLEYQTIECSDLAKRVREGYTEGRSLAFEDVHFEQSLKWKKESKSETISINIPRKSVRGVVLLCVKENSNDSEEFVNPLVDEVKVSIEGKPHRIYGQGLLKNEFYNTAKRFFGTRDDATGDNLNYQEFIKNKHAIVIDFRSVDDKNVFDSGRKLAGMQSGVLLQITKQPTPEDLTCHVFVVSDALVNFIGNQYQGEIV